MKLIDIVKATLNPYELSRSTYVGLIAAAILTDKGNGYKGVCIHDENYQCQVHLKDKVVTIADLLPERWKITANKGFFIS